MARLSVSTSSSRSDNLPTDPAPRLLAAGIDVRAFDPPPLSRDLWSPIEDRVLAVRGAHDRWEFACALTQRCGQRLAAGESVADLQAWLRHPAVVRLLKDRRDVRMAVIDTSLPIPLLARVAEVRRRLAWWWPGRLWNAERDRVLVQTCETWAAAVNRGTPVTALLEEPVRTQVRTARDEQLQQRGWLSQMVRRHRKWVVWGLLATALLYAVLWTRLARVGPSKGWLDAVDAVDQATLAIPYEQRAWPLVRAFWEPDTCQIETPSLFVCSAWAAGPTDPNWPEARTKLESIGDSWEWLLHASRRPKLGYLLRECYEPQVPSSNRGVTPRNRWVSSQQLLMSFRVLQGEAHRALEDGNTERGMEMLAAALRLARLTAESGNDPSLIQLGESGVLEVLDCVETVLQSGRLSVAELTILRNVLGETRSETSSEVSGIDIEQVLLQQLDRLYSPGDNGALTNLGLRIVWNEAGRPGGRAPVLGWLMWPAEQPGVPRMPLPSHEPSLSLGPILAPLMIGRREAHDEIVRMVAAARARVDPTHDSQAFLKELEVELAERVRTSWSQCRYAPVIVAVEGGLPLLADLLSVSTDPHQWRAAQAALALRLGFELHRRRTGAFPANPSELIPHDLSKLPVDPYDGQPLKIRRIGARRWLYSVGKNGQDDTRDWKPQNGQRPVHPGDLWLGEITELKPLTPAERQE